MTEAGAEAAKEAEEKLAALSDETQAIRSKEAHLQKQLADLDAARRAAEDHDIEAGQTVAQLEVCIIYLGT